MPSILRGPSATTPRAGLVVAFVALLTDMLVYGIAVPVLPRFPAVAAGGDLAAGVLFATYAAALVAMTPLAGRWIDQVGPRIPLLVGMLGLAAATILFAVAEPLWALLLARAAQGVAAACSWVAGLALVAAVTPIDTRARNLGLVLSATSVGVLVGPPLGGFLADLFGPHIPFLVAAAVALIDGALRIALIGPVDMATDDPGTIRGVWRVPGAPAACAIIAIGAGVLAITEPVLPRHLAGLGYTPTGVGLVFGAAVLAAAITTPRAGWLTFRIPKPAILTIGTGTAAAGLVVISIATEPAAVATAICLIGAGGGLILGTITPVMSELGTAAQPPALGAAFALFNLAYAVGLFLAPTISGPATTVLGFSAAMLTLALTLLAAVAAATWRLRTSEGSADPR